MLAELRQKAQVTIPKESSLNSVCPKAINWTSSRRTVPSASCRWLSTPKKYLSELKEEIGDVKAKIASGEQPVFDSVDALFDKLEAE